MFWGMPLTCNWVVGKSALAFTSCLCRTSRPTGGDSLEGYRVFPEHMQSPVHTHSFTHVSGFYSLRDMSQLFKVPMDSLSSSFAFKLFN